MLKNTLHTAIAAIAVSTICLSASEAAPRHKDLILDFESMSYDFVGIGIWQFARGNECPDCDHPADTEKNNVNYEQGTMTFGNKTVEAFRSTEFPGAQWDYSHVVCGPDSFAFQPVEGSLLLRGKKNKKNTITLATVPLAESQDMTNPYASGWCLNERYRAIKFVLNYQVYDATNNWRCAYIEEQTIHHETPRETFQYPKSPFYGSSWGHDSRDVTDHQGTLVIPPPDCY